MITNRFQWELKRYITSVLLVKGQVGLGYFELPNLTMIILTKDLRFGLKKK